MKMEIIYKFANGIFGVAGSIVVTTFIIKTGVPHFKLDGNDNCVIDSKVNKISNEKTFLMYCKYMDSRF